MDNSVKQKMTTNSHVTERQSLRISIPPDAYNRFAAIADKDATTVIATIRSLAIQKLREREAEEQ